MPSHAVKDAAVIAITVLSSTLAFAGEANSQQLSGDVGVGVLAARSEIRGAKSTGQPIPYLAFDWGNFFARIDTFGAKVTPMGAGYLELVGQYRADGYQISGQRRLSNSIPAGLGSLQITSVGAFGFNALHDFGRSGGNIVQVRYLAEIPIGRVTLYPEVGAEFEDGAYTRYYYGTSSLRSRSDTEAYRPGAAVNGYAGLLVETRIADRLYLNSYVREKLLDRTIVRSPQVSGSAQASILVALAYRF
jgi:outer membrane scaffolding protein for murein synthesis (MipA/OmpV family)